jgi:hypothetical protein
LIRNTLTYNSKYPDNYSFFPVITSGYPNEYDYRDENIRKYVSNPNLQIHIFQLPIAVFKIPFEKLNTYFEILRTINAFIFATLLTIIIYKFS